MSGNTFGKNFRVTTFGESHGAALGCIIDGCPSGIALDEDFIQSEMDRRRPGGTKIGTARDEKDRIRILSGVYQGKTLGTPITMIVENGDQRSSDYSAIADIYRPGHADYTYDMKYGIRDPRGGGRSSGRETLSRVAAGAVAKQILGKMGIAVTAAVSSVRDIVITGKPETPVPPLYGRNSSRDSEILALIEEARKNGDSLGGIVECRMTGIPAGLGEPVFDKADALLSHAVMSIGAVKGIEFGAGFAAASMYGSENNDGMDGGGFLSNNAGGVLDSACTEDRRQRRK